MSSIVNKASCNVIAYCVRLEERERERERERDTYRERESKK